MYEYQGEKGELGSSGLPGLMGSKVTGTLTDVLMQLGVYPLNKMITTYVNKVIKYSFLFQGEKGDKVRMKDWNLCERTDKQYLMRKEKCLL